MKPALIAIVAVLIAGSLGYWLGTNSSPPLQTATNPSEKTQPKILYYRHPMGLPDTSPIPIESFLGRGDVSGKPMGWR